MGTVTASCGHTLKDDEEIVHVRNGSEDCAAGYGFEPTVEYLAYCPACAADAKTWPTYLPDNVPDDWWFDEGHEKWRASARTEG